MKRESLKNNIHKVFSNSARFLIRNLFTKPRLLFKIITNPTMVFGESYFPELKKKNKVRVFMDFVSIVLRYATIEEYYYMYGLDVDRDIKLSDYVMYIDFMRARDQLNLSDKHNDSAVLRNKVLFEGVAKSFGISTPANVAIIKNGALIFLHEEKSLTEWGDLTNKVGNGNYYIKPCDGECGSGIIKISICSRKIKKDGKIISTEALQKMFSHGSFIIQRELKQHPEMSRIYPNSVNTIRLTTVRNLKTKEIEVLPPTLRIGANGSIVDNFSKGGVIIALDTKTGDLSEWGFFKPKFGLKKKFHPDTNVEFSKFKIPYYQEAKELAIYFHSFLNLHSIGWDIAITEAGPIFIEGNDNWEINLPQTFENPMKEEFKRLFL